MRNFTTASYLLAFPHRVRLMGQPVLSCRDRRNIQSDDFHVARNCYSPPGRRWVWPSRVVYLEPAATCAGPVRRHRRERPHTVTGASAGCMGPCSLLRRYADTPGVRRPMGGLRPRPCQGLWWPRVAVIGGGGAGGGGTLGAWAACSQAAQSGLWVRPAQGVGSWERWRGRRTAWGGLWYAAVRALGQASCSMRHSHTSANSPRG
jgi:hypothetical protein